MTHFRRNTNVFFFGVEDPAKADQLTYYGSLVASAVMTILAVASVW